LTADEVSIRIEDATGSWYNMPAVAAVQVVGVMHAFDVVESPPGEGGDDTILTGGGSDIVIGGGGRDEIDASGDPRYGDSDNDVVIGDDALLTFVLGELREIVTSGWDGDDDAFDDLIATGNGDDLVIGGDGDDAVDAGFRGGYDHGDLKVLSINLNGDAPGGEVDGVAGAVAVGNWNNLPGDSHRSCDDGDDGCGDDDDDGCGGGQGHRCWWCDDDANCADGLVFDDGSDADGVVVEWGADIGTRWSDPAGRETHCGIAPDTQNERLFEGYVSTSTRDTLGLDITGLDDHFEVYDVYVYIDADDGLSAGQASVRSISDGTTTYYLNDPSGNTFRGEFVEVSSTDPDSPGLGNYVVFRGVSSDTFSIRVDDVGCWSNWNRPALTAVQVIGGDDREGVVVTGDRDRDVAIGDNARVLLYGGLLYEVETTAIATVGEGVQEDAISTGDDSDIIIGGNGDDTIDGEAGDDLILGDNARLLLFAGNVIWRPASCGCSHGSGGWGGCDDDDGWDDDDGCCSCGHGWGCGSCEGNGWHCGRGGWRGGGWWGWRGWHSGCGCWHGWRGMSFCPYDVMGIELLGDDIGGDDVLEGGRDSDLVYGQFGNDTYVFEGAGLGSDAIVEFGGCSEMPNDPHDTLDFSGFDGPVEIDLGEWRTQTVNCDRTHKDVNLLLTLFFASGFEDVVGSEFDDVIEGNERDNTLRGNGGDDRIRGDDGDDLLDGADGDDILNGDDGDDALFGGYGDDRLYGGSGWDTLDGGPGCDIVKQGSGWSWGWP
ncbi:MAG: hypothetical protein L0Z54_06065, partial [Thermoplasmata archaeon]|nr:hypothetical protein [Thermoplasmata archaeon]